jgi:metal-dependent amidase/aminoacylase/carboxypeptidase family protein
VPGLRITENPDFELFDRFPPTDNDAAATKRVRAAFDNYFADRAHNPPLQTASEDFSNLPNALKIPTPIGVSAGSTRTRTVRPRRRPGSSGRFVCAQSENRAFGGRPGVRGGTVLREAWQDPMS